MTIEIDPITGSPIIKPKVETVDMSGIKPLGNAAISKPTLIVSVPPSKIPSAIKSELDKGGEWKESTPEELRKAIEENIARQSFINETKSTPSPIDKPAKDNRSLSGGLSFIPPNVGKQEVNPPMGRNHSKYTLVRPTIMRRISDAIKISGCDSMQQIKLMKEVESILDSFTL